MSTLSRFQLNAILRAALVALQTFRSADLLGGNVRESQDYTRGYVFNNVIFDARGFKAYGVQDPNAADTTADSRGWPNTASTNVISAGTPGVVDGTLAAGTYVNCSFTWTSTVGTFGSSGSTPGAVSITNIVTVGNTVTFTLTASLGAVVSLNWTQPVQDVWIPRDMVSAAFTTPMFPDDVIAYYSQFSALRPMEFIRTNTFGTSTNQINWADSTPAYSGPNACVRKPYSWKTVIAFFNAIANYPGSRLKKVWLNLPGRATADYAAGMSAQFNATPLDARITSVFIEYGNEHWNPTFPNTNFYIQQAVAELNVAATYSYANNVASIVADGTKVAVTMNAALSTYVDGTTGNPFIVNGAPCVVACQILPAWAAGSLASPTTITVTGTNTFTYPSNVAAGTLALTSQWSAIFNLSSQLYNSVLDAQLGTNGNANLFSFGSKWYVRQIRRTWQAWQTNRPQGSYATDKFVLGLQMWGDGPGGGGANTHSPAWEMAAYLADGNALAPASSQLSSWLYAAAIGPYVKNIPDAIGTGSVDASGVLTITAMASANPGAFAVGQLVSGDSRIGNGVTIASFGTGTGGVGTYNLSAPPSSAVGTITVYAVTSVATQLATMYAAIDPANAQTASARPNNVRTIRNFTYMCRRYGLHPVAYEGGPDIQLAAQMNIEMSTSPTMGPFVAALLDLWFRNGGEEFFYFGVTPGAFFNTSQGLAQGAWPSCQSYGDVTSPKAVALATYGTPISYADMNGPDANGKSVITKLNFSAYSSTSVGSGGQVDCRYWNTISSVRYAGGSLVLSRGGNYLLTWQGTDSNATIGKLLVDGAVVGTATAYVGGPAYSSSSVTGSSTPVAITLAAGLHTLDVQFDAGVGVSPGVAALTLTPA